MLKLRRLSDTYNMKVFTDAGDYFGDIEEKNMTKTKKNGRRGGGTKQT